MNEEDIEIVPLPTHSRRPVRDLNGTGPYGRLVVLGYAGLRSTTSQKQSHWWCRCDCGNIIATTARRLIDGGAQSCGCLRRDNHRKTVVTHGMYKSPELHAYRAMSQRCHNANCTAFEDYGARGIAVCNEWRIPEGFASFLAHIGYRPSKHHSLGRIENNRGYEPGNIRWETTSQQARNKRSNVLIEFEGVTKTRNDWAAHYGINTKTFEQRLRRMSFRDAVTVPVGPARNRKAVKA